MQIKSYHSSGSNYQFEKNTVEKRKILQTTLQRCNLNNGKSKCKIDS